MPSHTIVLSRCEGLCVLPLLNTKQGDILVRVQKDRPIGGMNDTAETVARKIVTDNRPQNNRKPTVDIGNGLRKYGEASLAMVVFVVELLGISVRHSPSPLPSSTVRRVLSEGKANG